MKKIISVILVLMLAFTLGACGDKHDAHNHDSANQEDNKITGMILVVKYPL